MKHQLVRVLAALLLIVPVAVTMQSPGAGADGDPPGTVEVVIRGFVPSEAYDVPLGRPQGGDDRAFGYHNAGTSRVEVRFFLSVVDGQIVGEPEVSGADRKSYAEWDTQWVIGQPLWWDEFIGHASPQNVAEPEIATSFSGAWDATGTEVDISVALWDELSLADEIGLSQINLEFLIEESITGNAQLRVKGDYLSFPHWEVYVDGVSVIETDIDYTFLLDQFHWYEVEEVLPIISLPPNGNDHIDPRGGLEQGNNNGRSGGGGFGGGGFGSHGSGGGGTSAGGGGQVLFDCAGTMIWIENTTDAHIEAAEDCKEEPIT